MKGQADMVQPMKIGAVSNHLLSSVSTKVFALFLWRPAASGQLASSNAASNSRPTDRSLSIFASVEPVQTLPLGRTSPKTEHTKIFRIYFCMFRAGIANRPNRRSRISHSLATRDRFFDLRPAQREGANRRCALRWIALSTVSSPKIKSETRLGTSGACKYFTLFGTRRRQARGSIRLSLSWALGITILLHHIPTFVRSIPISLAVAQTC